MTVDTRCCSSEEFLKEINDIVEAHIRRRIDELSAIEPTRVDSCIIADSSKDLVDLPSRREGDGASMTSELFNSLTTEEKESHFLLASEAHLKTLFRFACRGGDSKSMSRISSEWSVRLLESLQDDSVAGCIESGSLSAVQQLVNQGLDVSRPELIMAAIRSGSIAVLECLLAHVKMEKLERILSAVINENAPIKSQQITELLQSYRLVGLSALGNLEYREANFQSALEQYLAALEICSKTDSSDKQENLVKLEYNCARALFRLDRWVDSISRCNACIALEPSYVNAHAQRAQSSAALHDFEGAAKDYDRCISLVGNVRSSMENASHRLRQVSEYRDRLIEMEKILRTDHYTVLGVDRFSPDAQIKASYRQLAKQLHPDKLPNDSSEDIRAKSRNQFNRIQQAYQTLTGDEQLRLDYDVTLRIQIGTEKLRKSLSRRPMNEEVPRCSSPLESVYN